MRETRILLLVFFLSVFCFVAAAQEEKNGKQPDGTIVESQPCPAAPKRTFEQFTEEAKKRSEQEVFEARSEGFVLDFERDFRGRLLSKEEFERRENFAAYDCQKIKYLSDGLKVVGFIWKPKNAAGKKLPLVIANRGGNREYGKLTAQSFFYPFVTNGFVVIASQYRGADGGEGKEEYGGADVNDILNLVPLAKTLGYVDTNNVFMLGASRGGMMTFLAVKKGMPVNAIATGGGMTDLIANSKDRPQLIKYVWKDLIPDFATRGEAAMRERSAVNFAEQINVPVLIVQGGADWRVNTGNQALALANKLQSLGKTYELIIYAGDDHSTNHNRLDRERRIVEWFKKYMK